MIYLYLSQKSINFICGHDNDEDAEELLDPTAWDIEAC